MVQSACKSLVKMPQDPYGGLLSTAVDPLSARYARVTADSCHAQALSAKYQPSHSAKKDRLSWQAATKAAGVRTATTAVQPGASSSAAARRPPADSVIG